MSDLPSKWVSIPLTDICRFVRGVTYSKSDARGLPGTGVIGVLRANNIQSGVLNVSDMVYVPRHLVAEEQIIQPGDVVVATSSGSASVVGKAAQVRDLSDLAFGAFCGLLRPSAEMSARYFGYYFQSQEYRSKASEVARGVNINNLKRSHFDEFHIAIAPRDEQERIADKLDMLVNKALRCRLRLDAVPYVIKRFREAVLEAAIMGRLTEEWRTKSVGLNVLEKFHGLADIGRSRRGVEEHGSISAELLLDESCPPNWARATAAGLLMKGVISDLKDGNHGANHPKVSEFSDEGLPFITAAQVDNFVVDYASAPRLSGTPLARIKVGLAQAGDVVLTHKGTVGRVGIVDRPCVLTPQTTYYRVNTEHLVAKYMMYFMASPVFARQLSAIKSQTTRDFVPISAQYALTHFVPPVAEQREIVRRIDDLFTLASGLERRYRTAVDQVEKLAPSLLATAFRGGLVPQDTNDEPASVLLERIQKGREETSTTAKLLVRTAAGTVSAQALKLRAKRSTKRKPQRVAARTGSPISKRLSSKRK